MEGSLAKYKVCAAFSCLWCKVHLDLKIILIHNISEKQVGWK